MSQSHIQDHVELIAKHEQEFLSQRTRTEQLIDSIAGFVGSLTFVVAHLCLFALWIELNLLPHLHHFDPVPFSLLQTIVAMESILLASFILMRQARLGRRSDERDHLMLQILILTEKEVAAVIGMNRRMAIKLGLRDVVADRDIQQLSEDTSIDE